MALGTLVRDDGVRVEVKNPTIWKQLSEQQEALAAQRELLRQLQGAIAKIEADRDRLKRAFGWLADHWWTRLGYRLRLVPDGVPDAAPSPAVPPADSPPAPRTAEAVA